MKLFNRQPAPAPEAAQPGPHLLTDRGILADWFIEYRLVQEVERARRYDRPLAVLRAVPQVLPGETLPDEALTAAAAAATAAARSIDLVGWEGSQSILMIMPETAPEDARVAAARWQNEIWLRSRASGGYKWQFTLLEWQVTALDTRDQRPDAQVTDRDAGDHAEAA